MALPDAAHPRDLTADEQQWVRSGVLRSILDVLAQALLDEGCLDLQETSIDGSFAPAKQGGAPTGKTKRGKGSKIMAIADRQGLPVAVHVEGVHVGRITIGVFCWDEKDNAVGHIVQTADLKLREENYQKILGACIPYRVRFPVDPAARSVPVVVYDFKADLIGSADRRLR